MADLTVLTFLLTGLFAAVLAVAGRLPTRAVDWIDRRLLAPTGDVPAVQGRDVQTSNDQQAIEITREPTP